MSQTVIETIEKYESGIITSEELFDQLRELEMDAALNTGPDEVHMIYSNGIYFVIQSGICHQLIQTVKIIKL